MTTASCTCHWPPEAVQRSQPWGGLWRHADSSVATLAHVHVESIDRPGVAVTPGGVDGSGANGRDPKLLWLWAVSTHAPLEAASARITIECDDAIQHRHLYWSTDDGRSGELWLCHDPACAVGTLEDQDVA